MMSGDLIYFIQAELSGAVKIGYGKDPEKRKAELQVGNHERLRLITTCEGSWREERWLHDRLKTHHIRGEWFRPHEDVLAVMCNPKKYLPADVWQDELTSFTASLEQV